MPERETIVVEGALTRDTTGARIDGRLVSDLCASWWLLEQKGASLPTRITIEPLKREDPQDAQ